MDIDMDIDIAIALNIFFLPSRAQGGPPDRARAGRSIVIILLYISRVYKSYII